VYPGNPLYFSRRIIKKSQYMVAKQKIITSRRKDASPKRQKVRKAGKRTKKKLQFTEGETNLAKPLPIRVHRCHSSA
jgi:hypothetical protein